MYYRKETGAYYGKYSHSLSKPSDSSSPFLAEQEENSRDKSTSVPNTYPEHEVNNSKCPSNRLVITPHTDSIIKCKSHAYSTYQKHSASYRSVSYTHLRAHETVLDLVCRLLLEKKKS